MEPITPPSISIARFEITSLAFMFDWVPEPVCQTDEREVVVELAVDHLLGRGDDGGRDRRIELAEVAVRLGAARLTMPSARTIGSGCFSQPILKFCRLRWVCAPQ